MNHGDWVGDVECGVFDRHEVSGRDFGYCVGVKEEGN